MKLEYALRTGTNPGQRSVGKNDLRVQFSSTAFRVTHLELTPIPFQVLTLASAQKEVQVVADAGENTAQSEYSTNM